MKRSDNSRPAFTLVEILIVVVILGILAVIAIPKFSNASQVARESTLRDDLRFLRTQSALYRAQHNDVAPGYPEGNPTGTATHELYVAQMTGKTDETGATGTRFGPYLSRMPENPVNGKLTIKIIQTTDDFASDDNYGWLYRPGTNEFRAANSGNDSEGKPFINY